MSKYSVKFKEEVVKKILSGRPVSEISKETGVSNVTIYEWVRNLKAGSVSPEETAPNKYPILEKFKLLLKSFALTDEHKGKWFRENGVHPDHLQKWNDEIESELLKPNTYKTKFKELREENKTLKAELARKEKALAETAALLVLRKKFNALFEVEEK